MTSFPHFIIIIICVVSPHVSVHASALCEDNITKVALGTHGQVYGVDVPFEDCCAAVRLVAEMTNERVIWEIGNQ